MKHSALLLALAGLVSAPAFANETPKVEAPATKPAVTAEVKAEVKAETKELKDGTKVSIKGEDVFVVGKDGKETPAPDATHELKDGTKVTTKGGKIVK